MGLMEGRRYSSIQSQIYIYAPAFPCQGNASEYLMSIETRSHPGWYWIDTPTFGPGHSTRSDAGRTEEVKTGRSHMSIPKSEEVRLANLVIPDV